MWLCILVKRLPGRQPAVDDIVSTFTEEADPACQAPFSCTWVQHTIVAQEAKQRSVHAIGVVLLLQDEAQALLMSMVKCNHPDIGQDSISSIQRQRTWSTLLSGSEELSQIVFEIWFECQYRVIPRKIR